MRIGLPPSQPSTATASTTTQPVSVKLGNPVQLALAPGLRQIALHRSHLRSDDPGIDFRATTDATGDVLSLTVIAPTGIESTTLARNWATAFGAARRADARNQLLRDRHNVQLRVTQLHSELQRVDTQLETLAPATYKDLLQYDAGGIHPKGSTPPPPVPERATPQVLNLAFERIQILASLTHYAQKRSGSALRGFLAARGLRSDRLADAGGPDPTSAPELELVDHLGRDRPPPRRLGPRHVRVPARSPEPPAPPFAVADLEAALLSDRQPWHPVVSRSPRATAEDHEEHAQTGTDRLQRAEGPDHTHLHGDPADEEPPRGLGNDAGAALAPPREDCRDGTRPGDDQGQRDRAEHRRMERQAVFHRRGEIEGAGRETDHAGPRRDRSHDRRGDQAPRATYRPRVRSVGRDHVLHDARMRPPEVSGQSPDSPGRTSAPTWRISVVVRGRGVPASSSGRPARGRRTFGSFVAGRAGSS